MEKVKQINIKNWTYYFYNDQINLKDFDARLLKVDKKDYKEIDIYYIGYVTVKKIANCNNINSVNPLYLMINEMIGHFEEKNESKYLVLGDVDENKELMKKFGKVLKRILKRLMVAKELNMGKIFKKLGSSLMMICQGINLWHYSYWQYLLGMFLVRVVNFIRNFF